MYNALAYSQQQVPEQVTTGALWFLGGFAVLFLFFVLLVYVYMAISLSKIAKKTNTDNVWMAWIPVLNVLLTVNISKKPSWWFLLFFIPFVNIVVSVLVWMEIAKSLKKPEWLGILIIIPVANIILPGYLAFSKMEEIQK